MQLASLIQKSYELIAVSYKLFQNSWKLTLVILRLLITFGISKKVVQQRKHINLSFTLVSVAGTYSTIITTITTR